MKSTSRSPRVQGAGAPARSRGPAFVIERADNSAGRRLLIGRETAKSPDPSSPGELGTSLSCRAYAEATQTVGDARALLARDGAPPGAATSACGRYVYQYESPGAIPNFRSEPGSCSGCRLHDRGSGARTHHVAGWTQALRRCGALRHRELRAARAEVGGPLQSSGVAGGQMPCRWYHAAHCCVAPNGPGCSPAARARRRPTPAHAPPPSGRLVASARPLIQGKPSVSWGRKATGLEVRVPVSRVADERQEVMTYADRDPCFTTQRRPSSRAPSSRRSSSAWWPERHSPASGGGGGGSRRRTAGGTIAIAWQWSTQTAMALRTGTTPSRSTSHRTRPIPYVSLRCYQGGSRSMAADCRFYDAYPWPGAREHAAVLDRAGRGGTAELQRHCVNQRTSS